MTNALRNLPTWCPQHKGQSRVNIRRKVNDSWYTPTGEWTLEPTDEFWDEEGRLHCHYTYFCSKGHSFTLPCEADPACSWGRAVPPPPIVANGRAAAIPPPPPLVAPPPPPPPVSMGGTPPPMPGR